MRQKFVRLLCSPKYLFLIWERARDLFAMKISFDKCLNVILCWPAYFSTKRGNNNNNKIYPKTCRFVTTFHRVSYFYLFIYLLFSWTFWNSYVKFSIVWIPSERIEYSNSQASFQYIRYQVNDIRPNCRYFSGQVNDIICNDHHLIMPAKKISLYSHLDKNKIYLTSYCHCIWRLYSSV